MAARTGERPFVIGVTGNIACGKSTVLAMLRELGAETIDSDLLYHELIAPGRPLWSALRDRFGEGIVDAGGQIDRRALGAIVFSDPRALADLDAITHPAVIAAAVDLIEKTDARVVAIDAVKLVESGMDRVCDRVWLVECSPEVEIERLMLRTGFSREEALRRIRAQPELDGKRDKADLIIDNSGDIESTRQQVRAAWAGLPILPI